ncbi:MarR family winged helix-turn-helix transcriptional regulator [Pseudonocardia acidicola]|uniref:MarR family transcriptional regulator n=1 Tax=Pseudonocardia acidicola TaxID=2724939 RepID=A0ABX1SDG6_9PSEU|nr:MarR family transcriptional regulator [Pseudonocardia acidicola]NMH98233.1 MarR family transcriptional regulator [Pseudonocardia acidicola]
MVIQRPRATDDPPADPIDWARHFWVRQGLGDGSPFLAMSSTLRFHRIMVDRIEPRLRAHELNLTDYMLLMTLLLSNSGTRLISHLARSLLVHATTATLATDRLARRGLITREAHPDDRRATLVTITEAGRALACDATDTLRTIGFGVGEGDDEEAEADQRTLTELLARLRSGAGDGELGSIPAEPIPPPR